MSVFNTRGALLRTSAVAALMAVGATAAQAQSEIVGGGSTLAGPTYQKIFLDAGLQTPPSYTCTTSVDICYAFVGSGAGTTGFLNNDSTQFGLAAGIPVDFGAADAILSPTQISAFQTAHAYQLDQVPAFGTPITIPFNYAGKNNNAAIKLKDADLCGIFSGLIKDWSAVSQTGLSGPINVVYRDDSSGTSFLLTNHLGAVCTTANATASFVNALAANKAAAARLGNDGGTTKFATLFPGYTTGLDAKGVTLYFVPTNTFATPVGGATPGIGLPSEGSGGVQASIDANALSVGYIGPDYTKIAAVPTGTPPYVASVNNVLPTLNNTTFALNSFKFNTSATNPDSFGLLVPVPKKVAGKTPYPIVGYTYLYLSSQYNNAGDVTVVQSFLDALYNANGTNEQAVDDITNSGFVPVPGVSSAGKPTPTSLAGKIIADYLAVNATVPFTVSSTGR